MTVIKDAEQVLRSGHVRRWHQNPEMSRCGENNAEHQWNVATILLYLQPDATREQIIAALFHDVGELVAGDIAYPVKQRFPHFTKHHEEIESAVRDNMVRCEAWGDPVVNAADKLAALVRMHHEGVVVTDEDWWAALDLAGGDLFVEDRGAVLGATLDII